MKRYLLSVILLTSTAGPLAVMGQNPPPPKRVTVKGYNSFSATTFYGSYANGSYANPYFGFRLTAPENLTVVESESARLAMKAGADLLKTQSGSNSKELDTAVGKSHALISFLHKPSGSLGNSILEIVTAKQPLGVTGNMSLLASTNLLTSNPKFRVLKALENTRFGGKAFEGVAIVGEIQNVKLNIDSYVIMLKGHSLHFTISYTTEEGREAMYSVMRSIQFSK